MKRTSNYNIYKCQEKLKAERQRLIKFNSRVSFLTVSEESPTRARRQESDSDSEVSVDGRSLELASSHSSDDDESSNRHQHRDVGKTMYNVPLGLAHDMETEHMLLNRRRKCEMYNM